MRIPTRALTLHAPWAYAVAHLGKRVENRGWMPPRAIIGQPLAIHAGLRDDVKTWEAVTAIAEATGATRLPQREPARGAVVAIATVAGVIDVRSTYDIRIEGDVGLVTALDPWLVGPVGWVLVDVVTLPTPVPCKGAQGLWTIPDDVKQAIALQLAQKEPPRAVADNPCTYIRANGLRCRKPGNKGGFCARHVAFAGLDKEPELPTAVPVGSIHAVMESVCKLGTKATATGFSCASCPDTLACLSAASAKASGAMEWTLADQHREDEDEYQADLRAEFAPEAFARGEAYARMRAALAAGEVELLISADEARALLAGVDCG